VTPRRILIGVALGVAGIAAAVAIGLLANTISGDSVGLSAEPLSAGEALAPPAAERDRPREMRRAKQRRDAGADRARSDAPGAPAAPPDTAPPGVGGGDDDGRGRGRGRSGGDSEVDDSGSGSSGSGSDDAFDDSSGSGSGGSGGDDSGSGGDDSGSDGDDSGSDD
jgi:hypothetical protein